MNNSIFEIEQNIFCLRVAPSPNFGYNSFLLLDQRPVLIHTGRGKYFPETLLLAKRILEVSTLHYIAFSHFEADECGALNQWLEVAPHAVPLVGAIGRASIEDFSCRPPICISDGETISLGNQRLEVLETPHCPHGWDACLFYEPEKQILFSSDLGAQPGTCVDFVRADLSDEILAFQRRYGFLSEGPDFLASLKRIMSLPIRTLATQHGGLLQGSCVQQFLAALEEYLIKESDNRSDRGQIHCEEF